MGSDRAQSTESVNLLTGSYRILVPQWTFAMLYQTVEFWGIRKEVKNFEEAAFGYGMLFDFTKVSK